MHSEIQTLSGPSRAYRARFSGTAGSERRPESEREQEGSVRGQWFPMEGVAGTFQSWRRHASIRNPYITIVSAYQHILLWHP